MSRISSESLRKGLLWDLQIEAIDIAKATNISRSSISIYLQGRGGKRKKDGLARMKIYKYYEKRSQNPASYNEFWGIEKEYFEVV